MSDWMPQKSTSVNGKNRTGHRPDVTRPSASKYRRESRNYPFKWTANKYNWCTSIYMYIV